MSTCLEVLKAAYRRANLLAMASTVSGTELDSVLSSVGMERLQGFYNQLALNGGLSRLTEYYADGDYTAEENQIVYISGAYTITIPSTIDDLNDGVRTPRDGAVIVTILSTATPYTVVVRIYDKYRGWIITNALTASDYAPLSIGFDEHLKNLLAEYLAAEDGTPITDLLRKQAAMARQAFAARYGITRKTAQHEFF